jgi:nitrite reductase/ring-hydroxylating ferredoxin subunit
MDENASSPNSPDSADACGSCFSRRALIAGAAAAAVGTTIGASAVSGSARVTTRDIAAVSSVPVGGGRIIRVDGRTIVLTQPKRGTIKAFSGICTHQQCAVTRVAKTGITCVCHNSLFDITTGRPTKGPARRALAPVRIRVSRGRVLLVTSAAASAAPTASQPAQPSATASSTAAALPAGFVLLTGTLPAVGAVGVMDAGTTPVLVIRDANGLRAFSAVCPHAGQRRAWNNRLVDGAVVCNAHGSAFDPSNGRGRPGLASGLSLTPVSIVAVGTGWAADVRGL